MVQHSQYKIMGRTTNLDDILDLDDDEDNSPPQQKYSKFIREKHVSQQPNEPNSNYNNGPQGGPRGIRQQGAAQNMMSAQRPADPRFQQQQMQTNRTLQPSAHRGYDSVEQYEDITIQAVTDNIFKTTSSYIDALDNSEHPLHNVAKGLLGDSMPTCDKTIYIVIIIILCIAIACLLYRMNHT